MASWVGPTVAISVALIALSFLGMAAVLLVAAREAREKSGELARELTELRADLAPMLASMNRLSEGGAEVLDEVREELGHVVDTSRALRRNVTRAVRQAQNRLADLDALVEVATEEAESAFLDAAGAIQSVRSSAGLIRQVGRFLVPQPTPEEELDEDEFDEVDEEAVTEAAPDAEADEDVE